MISVLCRIGWFLLTSSDNKGHSEKKQAKLFLL